MMRKTGTVIDYQRRKRTIRSSNGPLSPKHWPTALIVCPKSLISNVRRCNGMELTLKWERELHTVRRDILRRSEAISGDILRLWSSRQKHLQRRRKHSIKAFWTSVSHDPRGALTGSTVLATYDSVRTFIQEIKGLPIS